MAPPAPLSSPQNATSSLGLAFKSADDRLVSHCYTYSSRRRRPPRCGRRQRGARVPCRSICSHMQRPTATGCLRAVVWRLRRPGRAMAQTQTPAAQALPGSHKLPPLTLSAHSTGLGSDSGSCCRRDNQSYLILSKLDSSSRHAVVGHG